MPSLQSCTTGKSAISPKALLKSTCSTTRYKTRMGHLVTWSRLKNNRWGCLARHSKATSGCRFWFGSEPESVLIMCVGAVALIANIYCLVLISRHRDAGVHMRASWIFSTNDVIANLGVIISGGLVWVLGSRYPDLIVGAIISIVVVRGGLKILNEAKQVN